MHEYMYWEFHEFGGRQAVRKDQWKLVVNQVLNPQKKTIELFDLNTDLGEEHDLAAQHPSVVKELLDLMTKAGTSSDIFNFESPTIIK